MDPDELTAPQEPRNRLLSALAPETYGRIVRRCEHVTLECRQVLHGQDEPLTAVYFPVAGVCSMIKETSGDAPIEVATIGKEGFVGVPAVLGVELASELVVCQIPGAALRLGVDALQEELRASPELGRLLLRYTHTLIAMIAQASACNRLHEVEERTARWVLMTHDRVDGDEFVLTQEFLAQMLGVRRQAVNVAAGILARAGLIAYVRGKIRVLDRGGLEGVACECYRAIRSIVARMFGEPA